MIPQETYVRGELLQNPEGIEASLDWKALAQAQKMDLSLNLTVAASYL